MKRSSAVPLPKLERLLLDGDIDVELAPYLRAVGFNVRFAPKEHPTIRDDVKTVGLARQQRRILVRHDRTRDRKTKGRLYPVLYRRGGRILVISGDSSQPLLTALGKVLMFHRHWSAWFNSNEGVIRLTESGWKPQTPAELLHGHVQGVLTVDPKVLMAKRITRKRGRRTAQVSSEQGKLL